MNSDASRNFHMPYLQAIQNIPGNTAKEKLSWIGKSASKQLDAIENLGQLHPEVLFILQVEAAVKHKRHEDITLALKSLDWTIVNRALKATWFFDGSQEIINAAYFSKHIFPYISHHTKTRVVCTFARCVKNPSFAQAIFNVLTITYNAQTVLSLLIICDQEFIYETIVEKRLILPVHVFEKIYYKDPELGVRLLKEYIGHYKRYRFCNRQRIWNKNVTSSLHNIVREYKRILHTLAKKRSLEFVDIVQNVIKTVDLCSIIGVLSKKCAEKFLKKAKNAVIEYPYLYMPILPSQVVSAELLEMMFPGLMKYHCRESFCTDKMLNYLKDFPEDKKFEILFKTYRDLYQHELLDKVENVTSALLKILPIEKRIEFAQTLKYNSFVHCDRLMQSYETTWTCYLPVHEAIPIFKDLMRSAETQQSRLDLILKMIYTCKVNKDEDELYNVLSYMIDGEYIINDSVTASKARKAMRMIFKVCEVPFLNESNGSLLCHIIRSFYIKYNYVDRRAIMHMLCFRFIKNLPITDLMDMLGDEYVIKKNMFMHNPQYERQFLIFFIERVINIYFTWQRVQRPIGEDGQERQIIDLEIISCPIIIAMYNFNERWCKNNKRAEIKPIRITNYPALIDAISPLIGFTKYTFYWKHARKILRRHEPDLYRSWFLPKTSRNIENVTTGAALRLLKKNFQSILDNWEEYLTNCKKYYLDKRVQLFIRATRWYKDIPIKFAERCVEHLYGEDKREMSSALVLLSLLLHGNSLAQLLDSPFLKEKIRNPTDVNTYHNINFSYVLSIMISNPPVPLKLVTEVLENYTEIENVALSRVIPRFSVPDVMLFAENMSTMSVMRQIYWIHVICLIAPINKQITFLYEMWKIERHLLIKRTLLEAILMLVRDNPCLETALLLQQTRASLSVEDIVFGNNLAINLDNLVLSFKKFASDFVNHPYVWNFFDMWLELIANYGRMGYKTKYTERFTKMCLELIDPFVLKFNDKSDIIVFQKFLFHENYGISKAMRDHALPHLLYNDVIRRCVINIILPYTLFSLQNKFHIGCSSAIRYNVYLFLAKFVVNYKLSGRLDYSAVIEDLLNVFAAESLKEQNLRSFLLVEYARIMYISEKTRVAFNVGVFSRESTENSDELYFGYALGHRMPYLVGRFSPYLVDFMAEILVQFLKHLYEGENYFRAITCIVRGLLMNSANTHSHDMATMILTEKHWKDYDNFIKDFESTWSSDPFVNFLFELSNNKRN